MPIVRSDRNVWCDYCKTRYPAKHPLHSKPASWTIISESQDRKGMVRHYCQSCAESVSMWPVLGVWELQQQINYACESERLNVQPE